LKIVFLWTLFNLVDVFFLYLNTFYKIFEFSKYPIEIGFWPIGPIFIVCSFVYILQTRSRKNNLLSDAIEIITFTFLSTIIFSLYWEVDWYVNICRVPGNLLHGKLTIWTLVKHFIVNVLPIGTIISAVLVFVNSTITLVKKKWPCHKYTNSTK
jgi:hypothetical protein